MMRFAHPEYLYALGIIPVLILLYWLSSRMRRNAIMRFGTPSLLLRLTDVAGAGKRLWKKVVFLFALSLLVLALANPQVGTRMEEVKQEGVDLFLALDVSLSMKAEDMKPNRLDRAKFEIQNLIERLGGDRIGLIVFAGDAFTQFPLTTDYSAANLFLDVVDVDAVPVPGTSIGAALQRALDSFNFEDPTTKVVVIISDGENNEGDAIEVAEEAAKKGVLIYTIGLGSPTGTPIPLYGASGRQTDFKRDRSGEVVLSKLDEVSLEKIATIGKGKYYRATGSQDELDKVYESINSLQKREFGIKKFTDFEDRYQVILLPALILIILELFLSERRSEWVARWNPLRQRKEEVAEA